MTCVSLTLVTAVAVILGGIFAAHAKEKTLGERAISGATRGAAGGATTTKNTGTNCQSDGICPKNGTQVTGINVSVGSAAPLGSLSDEPSARNDDQLEKVQTARRTANGTQLTGIRLPQL
jgi:hypothetical protein